MEENCRLKDEDYTIIYRDDEELGRFSKKVSLGEAANFSASSGHVVMTPQDAFQRRSCSAFFRDNKRGQRELYS